jgi:NDP-sugar pyrophosphorylase family protein
MTSTPSLPPAIVLAAGESRRFWPLSARRHKSLYRLAGRTILEHTLHSLADAGVSHAIVVQVTAPDRPADDGVERPSDVLDRQTLPLSVSFVAQPEPLGQGDAIRRCRALASGDFLMVQPENINAGPIVTTLSDRARRDDVAIVAAQERADFQLFAVIEGDDGRIRRIVEKPPVAASQTPPCSMGVYRFAAAFDDYLAAVDPGVHDLVHALARAADDAAAGYALIELPFYPLKYPEHLRDYAAYLGVLGPDGSVVGQGSVVEDGSLPSAILGEHVHVGAGARVEGANGSAVVIGDDAIVGSEVRIAAGVKIGSGADIAPGVRLTVDVPDGMRVTQDR